MLTDDYPLQDLVTTSTRIERLLAQQGVTTFHGLQYHLCEVGRNRLDTRALGRALVELVDNPRPRRGRAPSGPRELGFGMYASLAKKHPAAESLVDKLGEELKRVSALDWAAALHQFTHGLIAQGHFDTMRISERLTTLRALSVTSQFPAHSAVAHCSTKHGGIVIWVSQDLEWIYPDDWRLWSFLREAAEIGARGILVARAISPYTFFLLKAVGAFGLQYYGLLAPETTLLATRRHAKNLGWPYVKSPAEYLQGTLGDLARKATDRAANGVAYPVRLDLLQSSTTDILADANVTNPLALLDWCAQSGLEFPEPWLQGLRRWTQWAGFSRRRPAPEPGPIDLPSVMASPVASNPTSAEVDREVPSGHEEPAKSKGFGRATAITRVPLRLR